MAMFLKLMAMAEKTYDEEATLEENMAIKEQMDRIDGREKKLQKQLGCETEEGGGEE